MKSPILQHQESNKIIPGSECADCSQNITDCFLTKGLALLTSSMAKTTTTTTTTTTVTIDLFLFNRKIFLELWQENLWENFEAVF